MHAHYILSADVLGDFVKVLTATLLPAPLPYSKNKTTWNGHYLAQGTKG